MSNDLTKRADPTTTPERQSKDAASRLKSELMADALDHMFGDDKPAVPGKGETPRIILVSANDAPTTLDRAKVFQREMFDAASGRLEMKFAYYGPDDADGRRTCRITTRWISDADDMGNVMGRAQCECGCYVSIRRVLNAAVEENKVSPVQAMVIITDAFHDNDDDLDKAALLARQLRKAGTKLFLFQQGNDPKTAKKLKWLANVSGGIYFPHIQEHEMSEVLQAVSCYAAGGKEAVKAKGGEAATLLLEHLKQEAMPLLAEEQERVRVKR